MSKHIFKKIILLLGICQLFSGQLLAEEKQPVDAVLIMDSSGSMKLSDPQQLRKPAAKLFITLLNKEDKLSVMSFSSKGWPIRIGQSADFLTQLSTSEIKDSAFKATDQISHKGMHTNIHAALERGIELVKQSKQQHRDPIIVLMSDGKMDVGNNAESKILRGKILSELIPQLKASGIKVYSIAFTQQSDQQLLQEIADSTDGRYALAESNDVLHKVFAKIFEQSKEPNMLPLTENKFTTDPSIQEITIIANKKDSNSKIFLETPKGERHNAQTKDKNMKWFMSSSFDMITISKPEQGEWKILFSDNDNKAYIVADMQLRSEFEYNSQQAELSINAWLKKDNDILANDELINSLTLTLEIEHPDKKLEKIDFIDTPVNGVFKILFKPEMDGIYSATVIATSKTFQRQQIFSFRAAMPKEEEIKEPEIIAEEPIPVIEKPAEAVIIETPAEPEPVTTKEPEKDDLGNIIFIFIIGNLVLAFIGFNIFIINKMLKNKKQTTKEEKAE